MEVVTTPQHKALYESGFLNYALDCLVDAGSFDKYAEFLTTEPVMSFTNEDDWEIKDGKTIIYTDPDSNFKEFYEVSLVIGIGGDTILHSVEAGNSWFFKYIPGNNKIKALYVD